MFPYSSKIESSKQSHTGSTNFNRDLKCGQKRRPKLLHRVVSRHIFIVLCLRKKWTTSLNIRALIDFSSQTKRKDLYITKRYKNPCISTDKSVILLK